MSHWRSYTADGGYFVYTGVVSGTQTVNPGYEDQDTIGTVMIKHIHLT